MNKPFKNYMINQVHKIEIDKWNEGERTDKDPGVDFIVQWIRKNGATFKELWKKSICKSCIHCDECGFEVKEECKKYGQVAE